MGGSSLWSHLLLTGSSNDEEVVGQHAVPFLSCMVGTVRKREFLSCMCGNSEHVLRAQRIGVLPWDSPLEGAQIALLQEEGVRVVSESDLGTMSAFIRGSGINNAPFF